MNDGIRMAEKLSLVRVEPQPSYIESSGRWKWPLNPPHDNDGKCPFVYTASREWWEYVPSEAKPHPWAEGIRLRDDVWYWAVPDRTRAALLMLLPGLILDLRHADDDDDKDAMRSRIQTVEEALS